MRSHRSRAAAAMQRPAWPRAGRGVLLGVVVLAAACGSQPLTITEPDSTGGEIHLEPGEVEHDSGQEGRIDDHVLEQPPIDYAMPVIVIERTGGDFPDGFAGSVTIVPGGQVERRLPDGNAEVVEASFQLDAWHYERIALATWSYAHHNLPDTLPPGTCAPELDGLVVTYTFTDHLGETVIDTCDHDVSNEPFFDDLDAVFHTSGS